jgi:hypothetical protein
MGGMLSALVILSVFLYAGVNAFGAWVVLNRKKWVSALFLLAASLLVIAAAALIASHAAALPLLGSGLGLASLSSFLNAGIVVGRVIWRNHLIRLAVALALYLLADTVTDAAALAGS